MIITTPGKPTLMAVKRAKKLSISYRLPYQERNGVSIERLKEELGDDIAVVENNQITVFPHNSEKELFFHPNLAMIRAKRILIGEQDPLVSIAKLKEGMSFLDCTLGLASDSIVASIAVGPTGQVTGIEGNEILYFLVNEGLASFTSRNETFDQAIKRVNVVHNDHLSFLKRAETNSYDVVYFDPMFQEEIDSSNGINPIREHTIRTEITEEVIIQAKRVAKERVVLKDHWKSKRFSRFGFTQIKRKTSLFHYGMIEV